MADKKTLLMAQFYRECRTKAYTDMTDPTQSLKAKVIATDLKLKYGGDIAEFYNKAKQCYDQVQAEKEEEQKKAAIRRQLAKEDAARKAVNGELLVSISGRVGADETVVDVYMRPDSSLYSTINGGAKIEEVPKVGVNESLFIETTHHESKAVYTGATVGGITTGGVHYTKPSYSEKVSRTDRGSIKIQIKNLDITVRLITFPESVRDKFKRDAVFCHYVKDLKIKCYVKSELTETLRKAALEPGLDYAERATRMSVAANRQRLPYDVCEEIADLLLRVINRKFPPSDESLYAQADTLTHGNTSADLKRAAEIFREISDYRDASKRAREAEAKYKVVLQEEKEQAILKKEAAAKKRKRNTTIFIMVFLAAAITAGVLIKVVIPNNRYSDATELLNAKQFDAAAAAFEAMGDYKDAPERALAAKYAKAEYLLSDEQYDAAVMAFEEVGNYKDAPERTFAVKYAKAEYLLSKEDYDAAAEAFEMAGSYKDAAERALATRYTRAELLAQAEDYAAAAMAFGACGDYKDACERSFAYWDNIAIRHTISTQRNYTVALRNDGTVISVGEYIGKQCDVSAWTDIIAVAAGARHIVGLKANGTVVATGDNFSGQCEVSGWKDIVAVSADSNITLGLCSDGTVVATGNRDSDIARTVETWQNIVAVVGEHHIVGLKADGTVIAAGDNDRGQCNVSGWRDIVDISVGPLHTVGLKKDGTVVATGGTSNDGMCDVESWSNIVAISAGTYHTLGLRSNGTVVATGRNSFGECDLASWKNVVAISGGDNDSVGLKSNGTAMGVGFNYSGECNVSGWRNIRLPNT